MQWLHVSSDTTVSSSDPVLLLWCEQLYILKSRANRAAIFFLSIQSSIKARTSFSFLFEVLSQRTEKSWMSLHVLTYKELIRFENFHQLWTWTLWRSALQLAFLVPVCAFILTALAGLIVIRICCLQPWTRGWKQSHVWVPLSTTMLERSASFTGRFKRAFATLITIHPKRTAYLLLTKDKKIKWNGNYFSFFLYAIFFFRNMCTHIKQNQFFSSSV